jgi:DNA polymerase-2
VADFQPVLDEILVRTGLPVALEGIYRWVAFLPSRVDARVPVANRYFGVFQDGSAKLRGIEARRRDTPPFIAQMQVELLGLLAGLAGASWSRCHGSRSWRCWRLAALRGGRLPLESLLVAQKLSRELDEFALSPVARRPAASREIHQPGERVRFVYTRGEPGVHAWNLPQPPDPASLDVARYAELLVRAAGAMLQPFGAGEDLLRQWLFSNAAYNAPPGELPLSQRAGLPLWEPAGRSEPRLP